MPYVHRQTSEPANQSTIQSVRQGAEDHAGRTCLLRRDSLSPDISLADTPNFCRRFCSAFLSRQATADHMSTETEIPIEYLRLCHALPADLSSLSPSSPLKFDRRTNEFVDRDTFRSIGASESRVFKCQTFGKKLAYRERSFYRESPLDFFSREYT